MTKKEVELLCLNKALTDINKRDVNTRKILSRILQHKDNCQQTEHPDFTITTNQQKIIGIEHFEISQWSKKTAAERVVQLKNIHQVEIHRFYNENKGHDNLDDVVASINQLLPTQIQEQLSTGYSSLMQSFNYSYRKHLQKVNRYYQQLNSIKNKNDRNELYFLFDIKWDMKDFCVFDKTGIHEHKGPWFGIFSEMINILLENNDARIKYFIFVITNEQDDSQYEVFAFPNKELSNQIQRKVLPIFDCCLLDFSKQCTNIQAKHDAENIKWTASLSLDRQSLESAIRQSYNKALDCIQKKHHFITDISFHQALSQNKVKRL